VGCIVHMVRNSLSYVSYKDRKAVAADLRLVDTASTETEAEQQLMRFADKWDKQYPTISKSWLNHWQRIIPFFAFPVEIRKAIYTNNAIESLNMTRSKSYQKPSCFPDRRIRAQSDLPSDSKHCEKMDDADSRLETCTQSFCSASLAIAFLPNFSP
jgi:transposase-like protein